MVSVNELVQERATGDICSPLSYTKLKTRRETCLIITDGIKMFHLLESQKWKTHRLWFHNDQSLIRNKAADMRISCMHPAVLSVFPRYTVK